MQSKICLFLLFGISSGAYDFSIGHLAQADRYTSSVPVIEGAVQSQLVDGIPFGSYWATSFIQGADGHQYFTTSQVFTNSSVFGPGFYRGSVLNLTEPTTYVSWYVATNTTGYPAQALNVTLDGFTMEALSDESQYILHTSSQYGSYGYDLTFSDDWPLLWNYGSGSFNWGTGSEVEWAMPAGKTAGSVIINGTKIPVDSSKSLTWYDRQFGSGGIVGNWTWFELHLCDGIKASIWAWDNLTPESQIRGATILFPDSTHLILPVTWEPYYAREYLSPVSDILYALDWSVTFPGGDTINISSVRGNQEIVGPSGENPGYEGFVTFDGKFGGKETAGFGVVEIVRTI